MVASRRPTYQFYYYLIIGFPLFSFLNNVVRQLCINTISKLWILLSGCMKVLCFCFTITTCCICSNIFYPCTVSLRQVPLVFTYSDDHHDCLAHLSAHYSSCIVRGLWAVVTFGIRALVNDIWPKFEDVTTYERCICRF